MLWKNSVQGSGLEKEKREFIGRKSPSFGKYEFTKRSNAKGGCSLG